MNRFIWWHRIRRHRLVKFIAPDRPVTFVECRDCPGDKGWAAASSRRDLRRLPRAVTYVSPIKGGQLAFLTQDYRQRSEHGNASSDHGMDVSVSAS